MLNCRNGSLIPTNEQNREGKENSREDDSHLLPGATPENPYRGLPGVPRHLSVRTEKAGALPLRRKEDKLPQMPHPLL